MIGFLTHLLVLLFRHINNLSQLRFELSNISRLGKVSGYPVINLLAQCANIKGHSDGYRYLDGEKNENGVLKISDYKRSRLTGGLTFSFAKPFVSDIRLNFEKYFYRSGAIAKPSERDKIVVEVMTRF